MALSKKNTRKHFRLKKGGVQTRGQKRRVEEGNPSVEASMKEPSKRAPKSAPDPEKLSEKKSQTKQTTKKATTKKERKEARERLPSVMKKKLLALRKKTAKGKKEKDFRKEQRSSYFSGVKSRRSKKVSEARKKKSRKTTAQKVKNDKLIARKMLTPIKELEKSLSPKDYKSGLDKEILSGLEKGLKGLKIN